MFLTEGSGEEFASKITHAINQIQFLLLQDKGPSFLPGCQLGAGVFALEAANIPSHPSSVALPAV